MEQNECQLLKIEPREIFLGQVMYSKDETYKLYQPYAFIMGFIV